MRRPNRSNVMRRRLFNNGGMGMTKPGANVASGILSSSQPLVDVLAGQARDNFTNGINVGNQIFGSNNINVGNQMYGSNVQGTNLMNRGGVANFDVGGFGSNPDARISLGGNEELMQRLNPSIEFDGVRSYPPGLERATARSKYQIVPGADISSDEYPNTRTVDIPGGEGESRFLKYLKGPTLNYPLKAPLSGVAQYLTSRRKNENETGFNVADDFATANTMQLATLDALLSMNEGREEEILAAAKEVITNQGSQEQGVTLKEQINDILNQTQAAPTEKELALLESERIEEEKRPVDLGDLGMSKVAPKTTSNGEVVEGTVVDAVDNSNIVVTDKGDTDQVTDDISLTGDSEAVLMDSINNIQINAKDEKTTAEKMTVFKEEFKNAMPEYQGMSDEEKGNAWIKMGMSIAAGQSGNAITNIANGVLATIDEFADDPKQKREYEMKVALAGSKYALERLGADRVKLEGIEKEGRAIQDYVANSAFTFNGKEYIKGDPFQITRKQFDDGILGDLPKGAVVQPAVFNEMQDTLQAIEAFKVKELGSGGKMSDWNTQSIEYLEKLNSMKSGFNMRMYLGQATDLINNGDVQGASGYLMKGMDRALNAIGLTNGELQGYRSNNIDMYNAKMEQIGTQMLTKILNEGTKTISDQDRKRVETLIATMSDFRAGTIDIDVVNEKILALDGQIEKGLQFDSLRLGVLEANWAGGKVIGSKVKPEEVLRISREDVFPSTVAQISSQGNKVFKFEDIWDTENNVFKRGVDWGSN